MNVGLSAQGQALFDVLIEHLRLPTTDPSDPESFISYGEALEQLNLPPDAPRGETDGQTLQLNGLNDLARWVKAQPKMPRITGLVISRSPRDETDGTRRPENVPGIGFFREYGRKGDDWPWWVKEMEACKRFNWSPFVSQPELFTADEVLAVGLIREGRIKEVTAKVRERSEKLRDLARAHYIQESPDGKLHCLACDWAAPNMVLNGDIVELHHLEQLKSYPKDGRGISFVQVLEMLVPLCPNCHRVAHAKVGGGVFTVEELKRSVRSF